MVDESTPNTEVPNQGNQSFTHNVDMEQILREQSADLLNTIPNVDAMVEEIVKILEKSLQQFVQEDFDFGFSGLSLFSASFLEGQDLTQKICIRINVEEEQFLSGFMIDADPYRKLLALILGGSLAKVSELGDGELRPSEEKVLLLMVDQLVAGLVENVDIVSSHGVPGTPRKILDSELVLVAEKLELVSLEFKLSRDETGIPFHLILPLEVFDLIKSVIAEEEEPQEITFSPEDIWSDTLTGNVDRMEIPMLVELTSKEMNLTAVTEFRIGQQLEFDVRPESLRVLDESGATAFLGRLELQNTRFGLRVLGAEVEGEV
ncbi:MAG: hypothetical protein AAGF54_08830 [Pseudomonadota bacterium]